MTEYGQSPETNKIDLELWASWVLVGLIDVVEEPDIFAVQPHLRCFVGRHGLVVGTVVLDDYGKDRFLVDDVVLSAVGRPDMSGSSLTTLCGGKEFTPHLTTLHHKVETSTHLFANTDTSTLKLKLVILVLRDKHREAKVREVDLREATFPSVASGLTALLIGYGVEVFPSKFVASVDMAVDPIGGGAILLGIGITPRFVEKPETRVEPNFEFSLRGLLGEEVEGVVAVGHGTEATSRNRTQYDFISFIHAVVVNKFAKGTTGNLGATKVEGSVVLNLFLADVSDEAIGGAVLDVDDVPVPPVWVYLFIGREDAQATKELIKGEHFVGVRGHVVTIGLPAVHAGFVGIAGIATIIIHEPVLVFCQGLAHVKHGLITIVANGERLVFHFVTVSISDIFQVRDSIGAGQTAVGGNNNHGQHSHDSDQDEKTSLLASLDMLRGSVQKTLFLEAQGLHG